jgi:hypothetical protein
MMPATAVQPPIRKSRIAIMAAALDAAGFSENERAEVLVTCTTKPYAHDGTVLTREGMDEVTRIHAMCAFAKVPEQFLDFYGRGVSAKEAGAAIAAARAAAADAQPTDNHPPPARDPVDFTAMAIWKKRWGNA